MKKEYTGEMKDALLEFFNSTIQDNDMFYSDYDDDNDNYCVNHTNNTVVYATFSSEQEADDYAEELNKNQNK
jgi:hypothetical protein